MIPEFSGGEVGGLPVWELSSPGTLLENRVHCQTCLTEVAFCHLPGRFIMIIRVKSLSGVNNNEFMILIITNH